MYVSPGVLRNKPNHRGSLGTGGHSMEGVTERNRLPCTRSHYVHFRTIHERVTPNTGELYERVPRNSMVRLHYDEMTPLKHHSLFGSVDGGQGR